jgi:hypothetical protein
MMNQTSYPDVSGLLLVDARLLLDKAGVIINNVIETSPPKNIKGEIEDGFRVIRVTRIDDKTCDLLVCRPL